MNPLRSSIPSDTSGRIVREPQSDALSSRETLLTTRSGFRNSCCQIRRTCQPRARSWRLTLRSRALFFANFSAQKGRLFLGTTRCREQQCQKQPSTKTASRADRNTKSGVPGKSECRRHPTIWWRRNSFTRASSVETFPLLLTRDMISERLPCETLSAIVAFVCQGDWQVRER